MKGPILPDIGRENQIPAKNKQRYAFSSRV